MNYAQTTALAAVKLIALERVMTLVLVDVLEGAAVVALRVQVNVSAVVELAPAIVQTALLHVALTVLLHVK